MTNTTLAKIALAVALGFGGTVLAASPAAAAGGAAPGTGLIGGCNMVKDPTMFSVAMANASAQGVSGMFVGVAASGDPFCEKSLGG